MVESLDRNFGLLIAFGLPGFLLLAGLPPNLTSMLSNFTASNGQPSFGGFLYLLPACLGCGLVLSAVRWILVDSLLHLSGVNRPSLDFRAIEANSEAYNLIVEHNYRYYQFYSNSLVAVLLLVAIRLRQQTDACPSFEESIWTAMFCIVLVAASRDCLKRFYHRARLILGELPNPPTSSSKVNKAFRHRKSKN